MFERIARRYDLLNRLITFGQDDRWRRFAVQQTQLPEYGRLLDLGCGTGKIAFEMLEAIPSAQIVGADFTLPMLQIARANPLGRYVHWCNTDALALPFPDNTFDAVVAGYLLRNVTDIPSTLREQLRVLKPGGRLVILDTSPPPHNRLRPLIRLYLRYGIPGLGRIVGGKQAAAAYRYLPESTCAFKTPEELTALLVAAGTQNTRCRLLMWGTICVHWGEKPAMANSIEAPCTPQAYGLGT